MKGLWALFCICMAGLLLSFLPENIAAGDQFYIWVDISGAMFWILNAHLATRENA